MNDAFHKRNMMIDAMRITVQNIDSAITSVRGALRRGQQVERRAATYLRLLKQLHEYRLEGEDMGLTGPLWDPRKPMPFRTGFVGHTAEQVKALEWKPV